MGLPGESPSRWPGISLWSMGCNAAAALPRIRVPLAENTPDVVPDLQTVFERCYEAVAYARRLDYHRDPAISLNRDNAAWVAALLRERGLRA